MKALWTQSTTLVKVIIVVTFLFIGGALFAKPKPDVPPGSYLKTRPDGCVVWVENYKKMGTIC